MVAGNTVSKHNMSLRNGLPMDMFLWVLGDVVYGSAHLAFEGAVTALWEVTRSTPSIMEHARSGSPYELMARFVKERLGLSVITLNLLRWGQSPVHWIDMASSACGASGEEGCEAVQNFMLTNQVRAGSVGAIYEKGLRLVPPGCNASSWELWSDGASAVYQNAMSTCAGEWLDCFQLP